MTEREFCDLVLAGERERALAALEASPHFASIMDGELPLTMKAAYYGQVGLARELAARKPSLDLFEASVLGNSESVATALASDPQSIDSHSSDGFTALGYAAFFGNADLVDFLISKGANPNVASKNPLGVIPLHSALANHHWGIARRLIEVGSDVNAASAEGWTPLHYAAYEGHAETARLLLERNASRLAQRHDGVQPVDLAREQGHDALVELLLPRPDPA